MPADEGISFLLYLLDKVEEEKLYLRWIDQAQYTMSFDDFREQLRPKRIKSDKEILDDVAKIMKSMEVSYGAI